MTARLIDQLTRGTPECGRRIGMNLSDRAVTVQRMSAGVDMQERFMQERIQ